MYSADSSTSTVAQPDLLTAEPGLGRSGALLAEATCDHFVGVGTPAALMVCKVGAFFNNAGPARLGSANRTNLARPQPQL
jgi:hypothetical protein